MISVVSKVLKINKFGIISISNNCADENGKKIYGKSFW